MPQIVRTLAVLNEAICDANTFQIRIRCEEAQSVPQASLAKIDLLEGRNLESLAQGERTKQFNLQVEHRKKKVIEFADQEPSSNVLDLPTLDVHWHILVSLHCQINHVHLLC